MSWQCPICETVNQDVTPVCTVCDALAPVIESFLSLESIEDLREYNSKLDEAHRLEITGDYDRMLEVALEAIAVYKENGLAVEKARKALERSNAEQLKSQLASLLKTNIEENNYSVASVIIDIIENLHLEVSDFSSLKNEVESQLKRENEINEILNNSFKEIVTLNLSSASEIVEKGLTKYPSCILLQSRREDIKKLKVSINEFQKKTEVYKRPFPKPTRKSKPADPPSPTPPNEVIALDNKPKFPKPKRK